MKVNYLFRLYILETNSVYQYIVVKTPKNDREYRKIGVPCIIEDMNQTQLRRYIGNSVNTLYNLKLLHYNNVMLVFRGERTNEKGQGDYITSWESAIKVVGFYDKDGAGTTETTNEYKEVIGKGDKVITTAI